jgi:Predicted sugar isomerase
LSGEQRLILEYKLFEPAFYTMDVPDWGTSFAHCLQLGERAKVCVDTGHHAPGTNIEFIVAFLLRAGKARRVRLQLALLRRRRPDVGRPTRSSCSASCSRCWSAAALTDSDQRRDRVHARPVPQHRAEDPGQIRSVMNVQEATAKALLVDLDALAAAQSSGDVLAANAVLMDAYNTDVRPLLAELREEQGLNPDPMKAYLDSGYADRIVAERIGGTQAGWGA